MHARDHVGHHVDGHAEILLHHLAAAFRCEARPDAGDGARLVEQHAVEVLRAVDQFDRLEVRLAKLHRAGKRQRDRIDIRDARRARLDPRVGREAHDCDFIARTQGFLPSFALRTGVVPIRVGSY